MILNPVKTELRPGQITQDLVEGLLITASYKDSVILINMYSNTQGPAVTLRKHAGSDSWYLLESLALQPQALTSENTAPVMKNGLTLTPRGRQ
jgi:hypothetical protein